MPIGQDGGRRGRRPHRAKSRQRGRSRLTDRSRPAPWTDFLLAARVEVALAGEGHNVQVQAADGVVTLTINKHVLMLSRLEEELKAIASAVAGVTSVATRVGKGLPPVRYLSQI
ncbi:MAG: hypothetical protein U5J82_01080 [Desulfobacterales bacterium]|nr:hypothetical protein [Desulfobacterales bacterium]